MQFKNMWLHFKKICIHKYWVGKYCFKMRLYWQGITHDLSKFSPIEFFESAKYYQGNRSPIDACKEENGVSYGWQHHKGRNPHHYEYWVDNLDNGGKPLLMPKKYLKEMLADYLGAGRAYMGKDFTYLKELEWWKQKNLKPLMMHPMTKAFLTTAFSELTCFENEQEVFQKIDQIYDYWREHYEQK